MIKKTIEKAKIKEDELKTELKLSTATPEMTWQVKWLQ